MYKIFLRISFSLAALPALLAALLLCLPPAVVIPCMSVSASAWLSMPAPTVGFGLPALVSPACGECLPELRSGASAQKGPASERTGCALDLPKTWRGLVGRAAFAEAFYAASPVVARPAHAHNPHVRPPPCAQFV